MQLVEASSALMLPSSSSSASSSSSTSTPTHSFSAANLNPQFFHPLAIESATVTSEDDGTPNDDQEKILKSTCQGKTVTEAVLLGSSRVDNFNTIRPSIMGQKTTLVYLNKKLNLMKMGGIADGYLYSSLSPSLNHLLLLERKHKSGITVAHEWMIVVSQKITRPSFHILAKFSCFILPARWIQLDIVSLHFPSFPQVIAQERSAFCSETGIDKSSSPGLFARCLNVPSNESAKGDLRAEFKKHSHDSKWLQRNTFLVLLPFDGITDSFSDPTGTAHEKVFQSVTDFFNLYIEKVTIEFAVATAHIIDHQKARSITRISSTGEGLQLICAGHDVGEVQILRPKAADVADSVQIHKLFFDGNEYWEEEYVDHIEEYYPPQLRSFTKLSLSFFS